MVAWMAGAVEAYGIAHFLLKACAHLHAPRWPPFHVSPADQPCHPTIPRTPLLRWPRLHSHHTPPPSLLVRPSPQPCAPFARRSGRACMCWRVNRSVDHLTFLTSCFACFLFAPISTNLRAAADCFRVALPRRAHSAWQRRQAVRRAATLPSWFAPLLPTPSPHRFCVGRAERHEHANKSGLSCFLSVSPLERARYPAQPGPKATHSQSHKD